jgi:hypothetical protein
MDFLQGLSIQVLSCIYNTYGVAVLSDRGGDHPACTQPIVGSYIAASDDFEWFTISIKNTAISFAALQHNYT